MKQIGVGDGQGIVENRLCFVEGDPVRCLVPGVLARVPLEVHFRTISQREKGLPVSLDLDLVTHSARQN
jgi:hypothetical protein